MENRGKEEEHLNALERSRNDNLTSGADQLEVSSAVRAEGRTYKNSNHSNGIKFLSVFLTIAFSSSAVHSSAGGVARLLGVSSWSTLSRLSSEEERIAQCSVEEVGGRRGTFEGAEASISAID